MPATKLSRTDIVHKANKLAAELLKQQVDDFAVVGRCVDSGMTEEDANRMEKQILKIAERLRRA